MSNNKDWSNQPPLPLPSEADMLAANIAVNEDALNRYVHVPSLYVWTVCRGVHSTSQDLALCTRHILSSFGINPDNPLEATSLPGVIVYRQSKHLGIAESRDNLLELSRTVAESFDFDPTDEMRVAQVLRALRQLYTEMAGGAQ